MALFKCHECGSQISKFAKNGTKCGAPEKNRTSLNNLVRPFCILPTPKKSYRKYLEAMFFELSFADTVHFEIDLRGSAVAIEEVRSQIHS